jgi:hypothetical protein
MGVEFSREANIPADINSNYDQYRASWRSANYLEKNVGNKLTKGKSTLSTQSLELVGSELSKFFSENNLQPNILEIMSGNGVATSIVQTKLKNSGFDKFKWVSTELQDVSNLCSDLNNISEEVHFGLDCIEAIDIYGKIDLYKS